MLIFILVQRSNITEAYLCKIAHRQTNIEITLRKQIDSQDTIQNDIIHSLKVQSFH